MARRPNKRPAGPGALGVVVAVSAIALTGCGSQTAGSGPSSSATGDSQAAAAPPADGSASLDVTRVDRFDPTTGALWGAAGIYRSDDGGQSWSDITPPGAGAVLDVMFRSDKSMSVAAAVPDGIPAVQIWRTEDGGVQWGEPDVIELSSPDAPAAVDLALDGGRTLALVTLGSSNTAFSYGELHVASVDGTWGPGADVPAGGALTVGRDGLWLTPPCCGGSLYWAPAPDGEWEVVQASDADGDAALFGQPAVAPEGTVVPRFATAPDAILIDFLTPTDARSSTLEAASHVEVTNEDELRGVVFPSSAVPEGIVLVASGERTTVRALAGGTRATTQRSSDLPEGVVDVAFVTADDGWALSVQSTCSPRGDDQTCSDTTRLVATSDGGATWRPVALPEGA